jgi:hypothetical protein
MYVFYYNDIHDAFLFVYFKFNFDLEPSQVYYMYNVYQSDF